MVDRTPAAALHAAVEAALKERGESKVWLAEQTGIARSTINAWKTQPRPPQAKKVNRVAEVLGIDPAEARRLAGLDLDVTATPGGEPRPLSAVDTDVLLAEIRRRIPD